MHKLMPPEALRPPDRRQDAIRRRAVELVMLEIQHQPALKFRMFVSGFICGTALVSGVVFGLVCPV